jgi:NADH:ubiquinone oxidoreductase subunit F (NADH-binding)/Pyruvate/2-oxoacid:ferredoxin oxidoreductase delta subunit
VDDILNAIFHRTVLKELVLGQISGAGQEEWPEVPMIDQLPFFATQTRNILKDAGIISPFLIDDYLCQGGYKALYKTVLNYTAERTCDLIEQSELRGRGGSGYPTGKKWKSALQTAGNIKYLICNANESDPGAFVDRAIIENNPHRLLEGIVIASYAVGAGIAYVYLRSGYEYTATILEKAIEQARDYGFIGQNIFNSGYNLSIKIKRGAGAYVCGEETALIASLEGKHGIPRSKPPYPSVSGIWGNPTVVNNVETLANVPSIIENGPLWFKNSGTRESCGTKVLSVAGKAAHTGILEVPMGTSLKHIAAIMAGGAKNGKSIKAIHLGGPTGICIPESDTALKLDFESLDGIGSTMGLGGLLILDEDTCMVSLSKYFMEFLQHESCGKCIPCREGTHRMLEILENITRRPREEATHETLERFKVVVQLENLAEVIRDTSLCGLGQNAPNPVLSTLKYFRDEYEEHIFDRKCRAGICHDLRTFFINVELCTGCNICQKKCPENAIIGTLRIPHFIIAEKCTGCGLCFESCKFSAIYYK